MKKQIFTMLTGLLIGAALTGGSAAVAAGIMAERSHHRIVVDGKEVQMEAYIINGNNYVKLRDMGKAVGFEVYWGSDTKCVQVKSGIPYTGEAPAKTEPNKPVSQPEVTAPTADVDTMKQDIVDRTNALRMENGIAVLTTNDKLMQGAQVRADEMAASGAYSHTRPDGRKYTTVTDCKYVGENIQLIGEWQMSNTSLPAAAVDGWQNSTAHLKNMLNTRYGEIGIGLSQGTVMGEPYWYCVQLFLCDGYTIGWVDTPAVK